MANQRTFNVQGLITNGVAVGGLASLGLNAAYRDVVVSTPDGAFGAEDVDRAGLRVDVDLQSSDVTKVVNILGSTPGSTTFSGKESGLATWHDYTIDPILWSGMNLDLGKNADGQLRCNGVVRFADGTKTLANLIALTGGQAVAPTLTYPARLYRPFNASFDPDGADLAIDPIHVQSLSLSLTGTVIEDYGDDDIGHTGVDLAGWNPLQVTLVFRDAKAESPSHIAAALLDAIRGVLTVELHGRGGAANKTLTVNNLLFVGENEQEGADYTEFTLTGQAGWRGTDDTQYDLTGADKLFSFA